MGTPTSRITRAVLFAAVLVAATVVPAGPALAHAYISCHEVNHDNQQGSSETQLDHPGGGSYPYHRGVSSVEFWVQPCSSGGTNGTEDRDQYIATYADNLISGSWHNGCSSKIKGWKGNTDGDWIVLVANGTWYTGAGSCKWGTYPLRSRSVQKTLYADGHVITSTAINASHPHI